MADSPRIEELRRRVQADPASIAFAALAEEYRRAGKFREAVDTSRAGLRYHPTYVSARVTLGRSLVELQEVDQAERELSFVLKSAPDNLAARRALGELCWQQLRFADALNHFRMAQTLAPGDPEIPKILQSLERELAADRSAAAAKADEGEATAPAPEQPQARVETPVEAAAPVEAKAPIEVAPQTPAAVETTEAVAESTVHAQTPVEVKAPVEVAPETPVPVEATTAAAAESTVDTQAPVEAEAGPPLRLVAHTEPEREPVLPVAESAAVAEIAKTPVASAAFEAVEAVEAVRTVEAVETVERLETDEPVDAVAFEAAPELVASEPPQQQPQPEEPAAQPVTFSQNGHARGPEKAIAALERFHRAILDARTRRGLAPPPAHIPAAPPSEPSVHGT